MKYIARRIYAAIDVAFPGIGGVGSTRSDAKYIVLSYRIKIACELCDDDVDS